VRSTKKKLRWGKWRDERKGLEGGEVEEIGRRKQWQGRGVGGWGRRAVVGKE